MKGSPLACTRRPPSPRTASVMRKWRGIGMGEGRGVELHELHVDHPCPGAIGDGDAIATRARRVRRAQENLSQSASGQHGMPCHAALDLPGGLLIQIRPHTAQRGVNVQAIQGVVRRCQQVDGGMPGEQGDVGMRLERPHQRFTDGFASGIRGVDDAGQRMPALERQR